MRALYYFPQLLPIAVASLVMGWILRPENGALNALLKAIGLGDLQHDWLGKPDTALIFLMLIMIWIQIGYPLVIFMSGLQTISTSMYEAADIEGCTKWESLWKITFPMISSMFLVNWIYTIIDFCMRSDNEVIEKITKVMVEQINYGFSSAMTWIYFLIVIAFVGITSFFISKGVYYYD